MTNGEKLEQIFPNGICPFSKGWLSAEYKEPTTKNDLAVDCISRKAALDITWHDPSYSDPLNVLTEVRDKIRELPSVTPQNPIEKCTWIKYNYRTMCPKEHDADNPYWRIPENRMEVLKYCPYCGKEIEVEE
jgi:hypothetical protein